MRILGLVASARKLGNSDLLVREALAEAAREGADTQMIYLNEKKVAACQGCMACVFRNVPCHLPDDVAWILEQFRAADGLIVGAPTYVLGPAGPIKLLIDRFLMIGLELEKWWEKPRYGGVISVAGLPDWNPFGVPMLNLLLMVYQFQPVGAVKAARPGPGEVLLDAETLDGARTLGREVVRALAAGVAAAEPALPPVTVEAFPAVSPGGTSTGTGSTSGLYWRPGQERVAWGEHHSLSCPVCGSESFEFEERGGHSWLKCPICGSQAQLGADGQPAFDPQTLRQNRWSQEAILHHIHHWVLATKDMYLANRPRLKPLLARYRHGGGEG